MKNITILGSTGSIGKQTLDIVRQHNDFEVTALAAYGNVELLLSQILEFKPEMAALYDEKKAGELRKCLEQHNILNVRVVSGMEGLIECACHENTSTVVAAMVGMIGIRPVYEAIKRKKDIALANKETLVTAGHLIMSAVRENKVSLYPVDSEHSAIFQCLRGYEDKRETERIIITASGGAFWKKDKEELENVTIEDALSHPNWSMGKKITVDSATMVNKGLEVIEAHWLFGLDYDKISVIIQPQSVIHSMVEFRDGAVLAQLGAPDMRLPIQYALYEGKRQEGPCERLDFTKLSSIDFCPPDDEKFPALLMAYKAGKMGRGMPTVYNAANEWEVAAFLSGKESYTGIVKGIKRAMKWWEEEGIFEMDLTDREPDLEEILEIEKRVDRLMKERE